MRARPARTASQRVKLLCKGVDLGRILLNDLLELRGEACTGQRGVTRRKSGGQ